jgi:integrase
LAITQHQKRTNAIHYAVRGIIAAVGSKRPCDLVPLDIAAIVQGYTAFEPSTRYNYHSYLRTLLRRLAESYGAPHGLDREVPHVDQPAPRNRVISEAEQTAILAAASPAMRCFVLLCSDLALRSGTAVRISPSHYDPESGTVSFIAKKQSSQTLPVTAELRAIFDASKRCPVDMPYVTFLSTKRGRQRVSYAQSFKHLLRRLGLDDRIRPHDFRRTTAVRVLNLTRDIRDVQSLLGHKRLATTVHYLDHGLQPVALSTLELAKLQPNTEKIQ